MPITETISYPAHDTIQRTVNGKTIFTSTGTCI
jgi:hypothetical protein